MNSSNISTTISMYDSDVSVVVMSNPTNYTNSLMTHSDSTTDFNDFHKFFKSWEAPAPDTEEIKKDQVPEETIKQQKYYCPLKDLFEEKDIKFLTTTTKGNDIFRFFVDSII